MYDMETKNYVRAVMNRRKLTKKQLARRLGVSVWSVAEWLYGRRNPSGAAMILLSQVDRGEG